MPIVQIDGLPVPNLKVYTFFSILLVTLSVFYAHNLVVNYPEERDLLELATLKEFSYDERQSTLSKKDNVPLTFEEYFDYMTAVLLQEPICLWVREQHSIITLRPLGF